MYAIDPNQQVDPNFLGGNQGYPEDMDDGEVNANGMFNGNRGEENEEEEPAEEEYFDDAGDIGYLPADHVSFTFHN